MRRLKAARNGYPIRMTAFRAIDPRGQVVATGNFDTADAAHRWFAESVTSRYAAGWRMEVDDHGQWANFDDTGGFTAPLSRRRVPR